MNKKNNTFPKRLASCLFTKEKHFILKLFLAYFLLPSLFLIFISCGSPGKKTMKGKSQSPWYKYISSHTSGTISKKSQIRVLFTKHVMNTGKRDSLPEKLLEFTPHIKGKIKWVGSRELVFTPAQFLPPGSQYTAVLHLDKLMRVPDSEKDFIFKFDVAKSDFNVNIAGIYFTDVSDNALQELRGKLITADFEENLAVEKILTCRQDKKVLPITWTHSENSKTHHFVVKNIRRIRKKASKALIEWDGSSIGISRQGKRSLSIAPLGDFKVLDVKAVQEDQQYIAVRFSDPLDKYQNLNGLIWMKNQPVRFTIEENLVKVFPTSFLNGDVYVNIEPGIKDIFDYPLKKSLLHKVVFKNIPPEVRFVGKGAILPENDRLIVPFEAVNLRSIQVTAFQVFSDNMGQFLQVNGLDGTEELKRVGRYLWRKTIPLSNDVAVTQKWSRFNIDVTPLLNEYPGSLFRLELSFNRSNSAYPCNNNNDDPPPRIEPAFINDEDYKKKEHSNWDYCEDYYNSADNDWSHRNDPCHDAYYNPKFNGKKVRCARNFIASNIGLVAKMGESNFLHVVTTDIRFAVPLPNTSITVYNFQNQVIGESVSDQSGFASIKIEGVPFFIAAGNGKDRGYLKVNANTCLPLSHFDIGGEKIQKGIKGFVYGERGVWRPGDNIYLTFVLQDKNKTLPPNHPVSMEVFNPKGQLVRNLAPEKSLNNFHSFVITTEESALTGNWRARVLVGGLTFDHVFRVETIVPNRLKIEMDLGQEILVMSKMPVKAKLFSQWLHGGDASHLDTSVKVKFSNRSTRFSRFQDYCFDDPTREFSGGEQEVFNGELDEKGRVSFDVNLKVEKNAPGLLDASFEARVFEEGGDFSVDRLSIPFSPFDSYVGIKTPKGDEARGMLLTDKLHTVRIACLDYNGNPVSREKIEVAIYKIKWKWWWDKSGESLAQYASASSTTVIKKGVVSAKEGMGQWEFEVKYPEWGRYLIRARDLDSGHSCGKIVYIDWPGWAGRAREEKGAGASRLNFTADKPAYKVGDTAEIYLPEAVQGRALVSLENGTNVLEQRWIESRPGGNRFSIKLTEEMSPNIYVHVSLLQPHMDKQNDNPIRLYGVIPLLVDNPDTHLRPVIETAEEFRPNEDFRVHISEEQSRAMIYTLAVVDEGLLGLTRFHTPNPREKFYKRETLGVKTWDLFDDVVGAYGGKLERILGIGGDGNVSKEKAKKKRRFPPEVMFAGPFSVEPGKTAVHDFKMPQYIGAVRVMVVAGDDTAYGCAEKTVRVKQDLMLLSSLPRVLHPEEDFHVPVAVFVMNPSLKDVRLNIDTNEVFESLSDNKKIVKFSKPGDEIAFFKLKTKPGVGKGRITITASSGDFKAVEEKYIDVVNTNPPTCKITSLEIKPGSVQRLTVSPFGLENTNNLTLEVSSIPTIKLEERLNYLIQYPHGCLEQTMSKIFPQIYLSSLLKLSEKDKQKIQHHVQVAVKKIISYQAYNGGFSYWPYNNGHKVNDLVSNYTGHFLLEAKKMGYYVPDAVMAKWLDFQKQAANFWTSGGNRSRLNQAYRLYTLALAGKADFGAMNRLRENKYLNSVEALQLAATFSQVGQTEAANDLLRNCDFEVANYREHSGTFGSKIRDKALMLGILSRMNRITQARNILNDIIKALGSDSFLNTQETSYALMALAAFYQVNSEDKAFRFQLKLNQSTPVVYSFETPVFKSDLGTMPSDSDSTVEITNLDKVPLFVTLYDRGVLRAGEEVESKKKLSLTVNYYDTNGNIVDLTALPQGKDLVAKVDVANSTSNHYENIGLTQIFPSGWQIHNPRFDSDSSVNSRYDYQDVRDDRIYTYLSLPANGKKTFWILLNASYSGRFYLPGAAVEAMYDPNVHARIKGYWIKVIR